MAGALIVSHTRVKKGKKADKINSRKKGSKGEGRGKSLARVTKHVGARKTRGTRGSRSMEPAATEL